MARAIGARTTRRIGIAKRAGMITATGVMALLAFAQGPDPRALFSGDFALVDEANAQRRRSGENLNFRGEPCPSSGTQSKEVVDAYNSVLALISPPDDATQEEQDRFQPDYRGAKRIVDRVLARTDLDGGEQVVMLRLLANIELELENYPAAISALDRAVKTGALCGPQLAEAYYFMGTLYLVEEDYQQAIAYLQRFFDMTDNPPPQAYYVMAQAYAVQERWRDAKPFAGNAIREYRERNPGEPVRENYLGLMVAVHINLNEWPDAVRILETELVVNYPGKDQYWLQLAAGYQELNREQDAYAVQELRYNMGFLDESRDIMILADLHAFYGYPYKAATLVEREMAAGVVEKNGENYEKLGNYFLASQEFTKARAALIVAANQDKYRNDGKVDYQIGSTYAQDENWERTDFYLRRALDKGKLTDSQRASAWMILGTARYGMKRRNSALEAFRNAARFPETRRRAEEWIAFINKQIEIDRIKLENEFLTSVSQILTKNTLAMADVDALSAVSLQALDTARRARDARSDQQRRNALSEYRLRKEEGDTILARQLPEMEDDLPEGRRMVEIGRGLNNRRASEVADDLEKLLNDRESKTLQAQADLERAAKIIDFINNVPGAEDPDVTDPDPRLTEGNDGSGGDGGGGGAAGGDAAPVENASGFLNEAPSTERTWADEPLPDEAGPSGGEGAAEEAADEPEAEPRPESAETGESGDTGPEGAAEEDAEDKEEMKKDLLPELELDDIRN